MWDDETEFETLNNENNNTNNDEQNHYLNNKVDVLHRHILSRRCSFDKRLYQSYLKQNFIEKPPADSNLLIKKFYEWKFLYFQPITQGSVRGAIFILISINIGSSMLLLPNSIVSAGLIPGYIALVLAGLGSQRTIKILAEQAYEHNIYDYSLLVDKILGEKWFVITQYLGLFNNLGSICRFNIFIISFIKVVFNVFGYDYLFEDSSYTYFPILLSLAIVLLLQVPICSINHIKSLHIFSIFGSLCILFFIVFTAVEFPYYFNLNYNFNRIQFFELSLIPNFIDIICLYFFCFSNHTTVLNVLDDLHTKTERKVDIVVNISFYIEISVYILIIFLGYFSTY